MNAPTMVPWQLADDPEAYGDEAGWWIVTTADGEDELAGPFRTQTEAEAWIAGELARAAAHSPAPTIGDDIRAAAERVVNGFALGQPVAEAVDALQAALNAAAAVGVADPVAPLSRTELLAPFADRIDGARAVGSRAIAVTIEELETLASGGRAAASAPSARPDTNPAGGSAP